MSMFFFDGIPLNRSALFARCTCIRQFPTWRCVCLLSLPRMSLTVLVAVFLFCQKLYICLLYICRFYAQERDTRPLLPAAAHRSGSDEVEDGSTPVSTSAAKPSSRFIVKLTLLSILGGLLFGELGGGVGVG